MDHGCLARRSPRRDHCHHFHGRRALDVAIAQLPVAGPGRPRGVLRLLVRSQLDTGCGLVSSGGSRLVDVSPDVRIMTTMTIRADGTPGTALITGGPDRADVGADPRQQPRMVSPQPISWRLRQPAPAVDVVDGLSVGGRRAARDRSEGVEDGQSAGRVPPRPARRARSWSSMNPAPTCRQPKGRPARRLFHRHSEPIFGIGVNRVATNHIGKPNRQLAQPRILTKPPI